MYVVILISIHQHHCSPNRGRRASANTSNTRPDVTRGEGRSDRWKGRTKEALPPGAVLAAYSAPSGWYALERIGVGFMSLAIAGYIVAIAYAHFTSEGSRAMQLAGLTVGLVMLSGRVVVTWGHDWAPREARIV